MSKGFANIQRLRVLKELNQEPGKSVLDLADDLDLSYKSMAQHLERMAAAGLISKKRQGGRVLHELTKLGRKIYQFLRTL